MLCVCVHGRRRHLFLLRQPPKEKRESSGEEKMNRKRTKKAKTREKIGGADSISTTIRDRGVGEMFHDIRGKEEEDEERLPLLLPSIGADFRSNVEGEKRTIK